MASTIARPPAAKLPNEQPEWAELQYLNRRFPLALAPDSEKVVQALRSTNRHLEQDLGSAYLGLNWYGSRTLGYAHGKSDVDVAPVYDRKLLSELLSKREIKDHSPETYLNRAIETLMTSADVATHVLAGRCLEHLLRWRDTGQFSPSMAVSIFGLGIGPRINEARLETLEAILALPEAGKFWDEVRDIHRDEILRPMDCFTGRRERFAIALSERTGREAEQLFEQRKKSLGLPDLSEMLRLLRACCKQP